MNARLALDRFEGDDKAMAVLLTEDGRSINIPRDLLPDDARAGDCLVLTVERDAEATAAVREKTRAIRARLRKTDPGGDITL